MCAVVCCGVRMHYVLASHTDDDADGNEDGSMQGAHEDVEEEEAEELLVVLTHAVVHPPDQRGGEGRRKGPHNNRRRVSAGSEELACLCLETSNCGTYGQWWSILWMHRWQMLQCAARGGFKHLHFLWRRSKLL